MAARTRVGVVGTGALGQHHVRILEEMPEADLVGLHDADAARSQEVASRHGVEAFEDWRRLAEASEAIVLAVPTRLHAEIGSALLDAGCHVLVEKPITASLAEADALLARRRDRVLAVGHVEFYNPAVQTLLRHRSAARFVVVERLSAFTPRSLDIDVVLDLMIHDLQILHALEPSPLVDVRAVGVAVLSPRIDIANARLEFASGCVAKVPAWRGWAERIRSLRAFLDVRYRSLDYAELSGSGFELGAASGGEPRSRIRPLDLQVEHAEPLRRELEAFLSACRGEEVAYVDGAQGRQALETAQRVLRAIAGNEAQEGEETG